MKKTLQKTVSILIFVFFAGKTFAQIESSFSVRGSVFSLEDSTSIPGATVFLARTTFGTQADDHGSFVMPHVPSGQYKLVISSIGYETLTADVMPRENRIFRIYLNPKQLKPVVIEARRPGRKLWEENLQEFKNAFLGETENAKKCNIINASILKFDNKGALLLASADSLLVIENPSLGYRIKFLLDDFRFDRITRKMNYKGHIVYTDMTPSDEMQRLAWAKKRLDAYYGSELHFMRSLYSRSLIDDGFVVNLFENKIKDDNAVVEAVADKQLRLNSKAFGKAIKIKALTNYKRILDTIRSRQDHPVLSFKGELEIKYLHETEPLEFIRAREPQATGTRLLQRTRIALTGDSAVVAPNGTVFPDNALRTVGYWSWELVADMLPIDYDPWIDEKTLGIKPPANE